MPDDPRPRLSLRDLPPSTSDEPPTEPANLRTPGPPPATLWDAVFPVDTDSHAARLFDIEKRVAMRMRTGHSRTPPTIEAKLERQAEARRVLVAGVSRAIRDAEDAGIHIDVLRYTLHGFLKSVELDRDEDPL